MFQLSLHLSNNRDTFQHYMEKLTGKSVSLVITDNFTSLLSVKTKNNVISVRMHWMFLNADEDVVREIAGFIKTRKGRTPLIRNFIRENRENLKKRDKCPGKSGICPQGRFYDLREIADDINNEYFEGKISASIGWGKQNLRRMIRKRTLGSYCRHTNTVRINPVLDRRNVPHYFIRYIIYHEMLHSAVGEEIKNSRRSVHTSEFRKRERLFKDYEKAVLWERRNR